MMTSAQIRQSFLDFFKSKQHTIVPSSSLLPDSPNLLFTNAGMNQFVPIFLGERKPDVSKWAGAVPSLDTRAADTQKCIRAGGKHNDLDDVGLDTYHHTFFEMLGNWSFGDYFKKESLEWGWELITQVWKFPPARLYATVYSPDKSKGDPSDFDQEAYDIWERLFRAAGLDPAVHIVNGGKKDNFWMMGDTGPCGPCSEIHVDLTPAGDTGGALVNKGDARCIEIWNHVFIQFNANPDGTFSPLPAKHVDTGMGFERVTSIIQGTKGFTDFANAKISNYETDIFRPIFDALEKMSGKTYRSTLPSGQKEPNQPSGGVAGASSAVAGAACSVAGHAGSGTGVISSVAGGTSSVAGHASSVAGTISSVAGGVRSGTGAASSGAGASSSVAGAAGSGAHAAGSVAGGSSNASQEAIDIAFRVIADHIRTLSFAIADGIQPGNTDRNYVLRRILRRAVRYGRTLGFHEPFFYKLVDVLADTMGDVFPEIRAKKKHVQEVIRVEEEAFNKTLDTGLSKFEEFVVKEAEVLRGFVSKRRELKDQFIELRTMDDSKNWEEKFAVVKRAWVTAETLETLAVGADIKRRARGIALLFRDFVNQCEAGASLFPRTANVVEEIERALAIRREGIPLSEDPDRCALKFADVEQALEKLTQPVRTFSAESAFVLYDTYGFPLDLTELMAGERGLTVDTAGFEKLMEEQRARARAAQKKQVIELSKTNINRPTVFVGYDELAVRTRTVGTVAVEEKGRDLRSVATEFTPFYAEMGGQVGDTGTIKMGDKVWRVINTVRAGPAVCHVVAEPEADELNWVDKQVELTVDHDRRYAIQRHHTVTHLLHWALHEVASREASQKGSFVGPDKLTFDFNSAPLTPQQVADIEKLVNERILENAGVSWTEVPYADVKSRKDVMQFFGDKYGDTVRVVQIGGHAAKLDGYSMELCGGTHTRATGEIGLFRIVGENAIAAGVRRIEAIAGLTAYDVMKHDRELIKTVAGKVSSPIHELEKKVEALLAHQKELDKQLKIAVARNASNAASELLERVQTVNGIPLITHNLGDTDGDFLQAVCDALKSRFKGVIVLGGGSDTSVALVAAVTPDFTAKVQAGKIIQQIAPIVGGKGGGKPDNARGGGKDASKLDEALAKAKSLL